MLRARLQACGWFAALLLLSIALTWHLPLSAQCKRPQQTQTTQSSTPENDCPSLGDFISTSTGTSWHWLKEKHVFEGLIAFFTVALVGVTGFLAFYTYGLWSSTLGLAQGADKTERRKLRAYVAHEPNGAHFHTKTHTEIRPGVFVPNQDGPVKYFENNFGRTPASNIDMRVKIVEGTGVPPDVFDVLDEKYRQNVIGYSPPGQNIGRIITTPDGKTWTKGSQFFLFGYVDYTDIFGRWWRHRFGFSYDSEVAIDSERWGQSGRGSQKDGNQDGY